MTTRSTSLAHELKAIMRLAGRDPEALEDTLPTLSALHRVCARGDIDEATRVHFILHRLIPEYLERLPGGRDCRAIRELLTWQDADGELQSLTTRYHKAAGHLVSAASDFGRRQEPRLLLECARRFIALDHEDRLASRPAPSLPVSEVAMPALETPLLDVSPGNAEHGVVSVHPNLEYHRLTQYITEAREVMILNTWIPGIDILADALADALERGTSLSILLLHPQSHRTATQPGAAASDARTLCQDMVRPGIEHTLDVLAAVSQMVDDSHRGRLRVGLYDTLPSISLYGIDDRAFVGFFMHGHLAIKSPQIELRGQESLMGHCAFREMAALGEIAYEITDISQWRSETCGPPLPTRACRPRQDSATSSPSWPRRNSHHERTPMTDEQPHNTGSAWTRWRERRRVKRQMAIEREYHEPDRLDPATRAYTDADNHARRWTSYLGGGGIG